MTVPAAILPAATLDDSGAAAVSADSPWLGLASFTEDTRAFFFGREQEITELERRVQRKLLTVLFGKSGLGKTSILQAGLVPGLRARGYFPVYLRIDYGHDSPEASEQIKQAINRAAAVRAGEAALQAVPGQGADAQGAGQGPAAEGAAQGSNGQVAAGQGAVGQGRLGHGAAAPAIDPEESIWEFLHHREGAQSSEAVPQDVSAATRTVKSPATQTTAAEPFTALAPTEPLQTPSPSAPRMPPTLHTATAPLPPAAPHRPSAPLGATAPHRPPAPPTPTPTPIPLLIFDQFEELFTLAQSDEFGRARAARFVEELADLVENRPPKALEAKLDSDDSLSERFDFSRSDYRVVIALREDYLAPLESLKKQMPSLSQNRLRLAPMTGSQALEAVLLPGQRLAENPVLPGQRLRADAARLPGRPSGAGRALVSQEVAEAIVRFVAGGAELANAEVEPSLLSLICRELNEQRIAQGRAEISLDLLAGSHETILSSFYERALADQPPAVRSLIEDELLTESGYRENLAEESLLRKLQTAGAAPDALAKLVNRRLLRIEERLDVRRVELTHDVLTGVVKASRDQRHEREARAATERLLAEQAARESAARRALRRARAIAAGCTLLALVAIAAAVAALLGVQRARHAEQVARQTRAISEQARQEAEGLLGFLTDDFVKELETFGRDQTVAELSQREIDYFKALPPQLKDAASIRNGALALVNHAEALQYLGDPRTGARDAAEAIALLRALPGSEGSEATTVALGRAYRALGWTVAGSANLVEARASLERAVALLRPVAERPGAPVEARGAYLQALSKLGWVDVEVGQSAAAMQVEREALRIGTQLGAARQSDLSVEADYAFAGVELADALLRLGRTAEAQRADEDAAAVADRVVAQRPQYGWALFGKQLAELQFYQAALAQLDPAAALRYAMQQVQTTLAMVRIEPGNTFYVNELGIAYDDMAGSLWAAGRLREAVGYLRKGMESYGEAGASGVPIYNFSLGAASALKKQVLLGDAAGIAATAAVIDATLSPSALRKLGPDSVLGPEGSLIEQFVPVLRAYAAAGMDYEHDDFAGSGEVARRTLAQLPVGRPSALASLVPYLLADLEGHAEYALGDFAAAAQSERTALEAVEAAVAGAGSDEEESNQRDVAQVATWLSMALAREGKREEAAQTIAPVVTMYRALEKRNRGDRWLPLELAAALYAQSLTDDAQRTALLREAAALIEHLTPAIAVLHDTRAWRARIEVALRLGKAQQRASRAVTASGPAVATASAAAAGAAVATGPAAAMGSTAATTPRSQTRWVSRR